MDGIIVVNKEKGFSSFDVIAVLRGVLGMKKLGHTGTLDPDAEGVLPVCLGFATKICDHLMAQKKEYIAKGKLGITTDTQDISGTVLTERQVHVTREQFTEALAGFVGEIRQLTPMYSARKVGGVKLVDLARKGITIERSEKTVRVYEAEVLAFDESEDTYEIRIVCQKGTYIRTICNDLGEALGCGSCMTALTRTATGRFTVGQSYTIDELRTLRDSGRLQEAVIPIDAMYRGCRPFELKEEYAKSIRNGNYLEPEWLTECEEPVPAQYESIYENLLGKSEPYCIRVYLGGEFYAIYEKRGRRYRPLQMYHEVDNEQNCAKNKAEAAARYDASVVVTVGKFDGLHTGHRNLLEEMKKIGLTRKMISVIPSADTKGIFTQDEIRAIATDLGVSEYIPWPLTEENRSMSPEEFVRNILIGQCHATDVVVGENFRFGRDQSGDAKAMQEIATANGIRCRIVPMVGEGGEPVSSTRIRSLLEEGDMESVSKLLGIPYSVEGIIQRGKEIGHTLGFPTINLIPTEEKLLPPFGVYRTKTTVLGRTYRSVTNVGDNPTVRDGIHHQITVETHIPGFDRDAYGEYAKVRFLSRLRGQVQFGSLDELREQLQKDVTDALRTK